MRIDFQQDDSSGLDALEAAISPGGSIMERIGIEMVPTFVDHFLAKDRQPKKGERAAWRKTGFWAEIAGRTQFGEATADGFTILVGDGRIRPHVAEEPTTITPKAAKALTIPKHSEAHGRRASVLESALGIKLFIPKGKGILMGMYNGAATVFYALAKSVTIDPDPEALPSEETVQESADRTLNDLIERFGDDG